MRPCYPASATIIFNERHLDEIHFKTVENLDLTIRRQGHEIEMEFPVYDTVPFTVPQDMLKALGIGVAINAAFSLNNGIILLEITFWFILPRTCPIISDR